jgi:hypothetical protein
VTIKITKLKEVTTLATVLISIKKREKIEKK